MYYCESCFDGYFLDSGICKLPATICLYSSDNLKYDDACTALTSATAQAAITVTCKAGYYKEGRSTGNGKCRKCTSVNCGGNCSPDTVNDPKCNSTVAVTGYFLTATDTVPFACTTKFGTGCKVCTKDNCTEVMSD